MCVYGATYLLQAEILDVDVASESRIEQQIPAGVVIVVVDVYAVAVPCPIAAAIEVVGGHHPVRIVVQHHAPRPVIDSPRDKLRFHVFVAAMRVRPARPHAVVFGIPVAVVGVLRVIPALVFSIVVPIIAAIFVFLLTFVLAIVVPVIAVPLGCCDRERSCQSHEQSARYDFAHKCFLQKLPCWSVFLRLMPQNLPVRISTGKWVHDSLSSQAAFPFQEQEICFVHSVRPRRGMEHRAAALSLEDGVYLRSFHALRPYNPADPEVTVLRRILSVALLALLPTPALAQQTPQEKEQILWQKLEAAIQDIDRNLDGVLAVAILDLSTGQKYLFHADEVLPTASSIKIAILAELYHQVQQGKLKLGDLYTLQSSDLVGGSGVAGALTPGVTRLTLRDVAALMISVSDNSATNVIIDRIGMENVNALLDSLGLTHTRLRRKMMDVKAAAEGRENIATPREMLLLLEDLYRAKILNKQMTDDFFELLSIHKESYIPRELPEDLRIANKPGELEGVRNDSGIVFTGNRPFVISVMTTYLHREKDGGEAIIRIATAAYQMFDRLSRASPYGRVVSAHDTGNP